MGKEERVFDAYIRVSQLGDRTAEEATEVYEAQCRDWADRNEPTYHIWYSAGGNFQSRVGVTAAMLSLNGAEVPAQVAEVGEECGAVEKGRQEDHQHDVGIEVHIRQAGNESEQRAADDKHDRIRDRESASQGAQHGNGDEQPDDQKLGLAHSSSVTIASPPG